MSNTISILRNTSSNDTISFATKVDFQTGTLPNGIAVGDIDGDGLPEIVVANSSSNTISIFRNISTAGNISLAARIDFTTGSYPFRVAIGDLNNDGKPDVVVTNLQSNTISIYQNQSTRGTISASSKIDIGTGNNPNDVTITDFNGDGSPDLVVTSGTDTSASIYKNISTVGNIAFANFVTLHTNYDPVGVVMADIDGDGKPDILTANTANSTTGTVSILLNNLMISAPQNLTATAGNGQVTLKWNKNTEADFLKYRIYKGTTSGGETLVDSTSNSITDTTRTSTGLTNGTTYYFKITAIDSARLESGYSNEVSITPSVLNALREYNPDTSTVLLMHMDETSGSTVNDASAYGNNGAATGTTIVAARFGNGRHLNGTSDYLLVNNANSLNMTNQISVEMWMNLVASQSQNLISKDGAYQLYVMPNNQVLFGVYSGYPWQNATTTPTIQLNTWTHVAATYNNSTKEFKIYFNGALVQDTTIASANLTTTSNPLYIGRNGSSSVYFVDGTIDELRISNKIRSPQEFNLQLPPVSLVATPTGTTINLTWQNGGGAVPLMRYKIYRGADSINISSVDSTTSTSKANTVTGNGTYFYRVSAVDSTGFEGAASYAVKVVVSTPPAAPQNLAATVGNAQVTLKWNKNTESDFLKYRIYRGTTSGGEILADSTSASITDTTRLVSGLTNGTTYYFRITAIDSSRLESNYSNEVSATPGMLNAQHEYNSDTSTVLLLHMDETSGQTVIDASGKNNNGTATGTSIVAGRFGNARSLNGTSDYILAPSGVWFTGNFTIEAWVYERSYNSWSRLIDFGNGSASDNIVVALSNATSGQINFQIYQGSSGGPSVESPASLPLNQWNHVACVLNGTTGTIYINGVAVATGTMSVPNSLTRTIDYIGRSNWSGDSYANAIFDEIRISNKARSPQEFNLQLAPTNLTATLASSTTATLTWQNGGGMAPLMRYRIYRGSSPTSVLLIDSTTQTTYTNTGLASATTYYYRVSAVDSTGYEGVKSNAAAITTAVPSTPTQLLPVNATYQPPSLSLVWNASVGASAYHVQIGTDSNFVTGIFLEDSTVTDTSRCVKSLAFHTTYYWRVSAKDLDGSSAYSSNRHFTTDSLVSGHSILLDGTSGYISVANASSLQISGPITLEAWVKRQVGGSGTPKIIDKNYYTLYFDGTGTMQKVILLLGGVSTSITSNQYVRAGVWYHIAGVYDGSKMKLYINGVLDNTVAASGTIYTSTDALIMGREYYTGANLLKGQVDEVRVWNVARDSNQIPYGMVHTLGGNETGLVGYWRLDESSGTTTYDATPNANNGTLTGGASFVVSGAFPPPPRNVAAQPGNGKVTLSWQATIAPTATQYRVYRSTASVARQLVTTLNVGTNGYTDSPPTNDTTYFYQVTTVDSSNSEGDYSPAVAVTPHANLAGNAVVLDGATGYVSVPDDLSLRISGPITLEAWVKRQVGGSGSPKIIDKNEYTLYFDGTGATQKVILALSGVSTSITSNQYVRAGVWYHIAGVYDGSKMKLYINGVLDNTVAASGTIYTSTDALIMGREYYTGANLLKGQVDEVRVWNVARDSNQIPYGMVHTLGGNETGLVGYWRLDESSGTTTYDATPNANNGTLTGGASFVVSGAFPPPPRNVAAQPGNGKVTLSWQATIAPTATQYRVYRSTASVARQLVTTLNVGTNGYTDSPPTNDTTYFYQVTTVDSSNSEGDYSPAVAVTPHANLAGNAVVLDGATGYVSVPDDLSLRISGPITLEAWVKRQVGGSGSPKIIDKNEYTLYFDGTGATQKVILALSGVSTSITSNQYVRAGVWYHIAGVYDGSKMKLYINGVLDNTVAASGTVYTSTDALIMGREYYTGANLLKGQVDEVRVWNVARDSNQIPYGMVHTLGGNETGLVGYWRLDESSGTTTYDASVYGNNGTLSGNYSFTLSGVTPYRVTSLAASTAGSKINLSWSASASPNVLRYRIYRHLYTDPNFSLRDSTNGPATTYTDSVGLSTGLTYDYTITVVDSNSFVSDTSNIAYATVSGGTTVISNITSNTTWTKANSPYKIVNNITVASGATLTIQPGVTVQLDLGVSITINGVLKAIGTSVDSIYFTTLQPAPAPSQWEYLLFTNKSLPVSELRYCDVEFGGSSNNPAISSNTSGIQLEISNSLIWKNYQGIYLPGTSTDSISFATISQNTSDGVTGNGIVLMYEDTVVQNGGNGIHATGLVMACKVASNGGYGVDADSLIASSVCNNGGAGVYNTILIRSNAISGNAQVGATLYGSGIAIADSNVISLNAGGGINGANNTGAAVPKEHRLQKHRKFRNL